MNMKSLKDYLLASVFTLFSCVEGSAQSTPGLIYGQIPTAAQWNAYFAAKQDLLAYTPLSTQGGILSGPLTTVASSAVGGAGFNIAPGISPNSPNNGDLWVTSSGLFIHMSGTTIGPFAPGVVSSALAPLSISGGGVIAITGYFITLTGTSSGAATIQVAANAGSTTFQLPTTNGSGGNLIMTNGSGVLSYTAYTGGIWSSGGSVAANISRADRLLVGTATNSSGFTPDTSEDWLENLIPFTTSVTQLASISPLSGNGVLGAVRSSDQSGSFSKGVAAYANNNTAGGYSWGFYGEAWDNTSGTNAQFTTAMDLEIVNKNSISVTIDPYNMNATGETIGLWMGSGGARSGAQLTSAAIGILDNGAPYNSGIVFKSTSLGTSGNPIAIALPQNYAVSWYTATGVLGGSIYSSTAGGVRIHTTTTSIDTVNFDTNGHINTTASPPTVTGSCGTLPSIVGNDWAGKVTTGATGTVSSCTVNWAIPYINASGPYCIVYNTFGSVPVSAFNNTGMVFTATTNNAPFIYHCFGPGGG